MNEIRNIAVYCGSSCGNDVAFSKVAFEFGCEMARRGIGLVYGGGSTGIMGQVARGCRDNGGKVTGVIPFFLRSIPAVECGKYETEVVEVKDMHQRKKTMSDLADAFVALPGGIGTIDEIFEQIAWVQLQIHKKPCGFLNINGFYDHLIQFLDSSVEKGLVKPGIYQTIQWSDSPSVLIDQLITTEINLESKVG